MFAMTVGLLLAMNATPGAAAPAHGAGHALVTDLPAGFLPEGVEWDALHRRFLVSSIREQRIAAVDPSDGHARDFAKAPGSVLGFHIAPRAHVVWATWTRFGHAFVHNPASGIAAWSLRDGRALGNWPLPGSDPRANLGDLLILDAHTIIASDSGTGAIWRFDTRTHRYSKVVSAGKFQSPQGLAPGRVAGTFYLADYPTGLWRITLKDGTATHLQAPADTEVRGVDGLYRYGDRLIAVQNGTHTPRILVIAFDARDSITSVRRWRELPDTEPSLGTLADGYFWFVANGQWNSYDGDLKPNAGAKLERPRLRGLPLSELAAPQ
ncbi:MAG TPA: hypothetical protein VGK80_02110 [Rhodanobacteraceae bacterium]